MIVLAYVWILDSTMRPGTTLALDLRSVFRLKSAKSLSLVDLFVYEILCGRRGGKGRAPTSDIAAPPKAWRCERERGCILGAYHLLGRGALEGTSRRSNYAMLKCMSLPRWFTNPTVILWQIMFFQLCLINLSYPPLKWKKEKSPKNKLHSTDPIHFESPHQTEWQLSAGRFLRILCLSFRCLWGMKFDKYGRKIGFGRGGGMHCSLTYILNFTFWHAPSLNPHEIT